MLTQNHSLLSLGGFRGQCPLNNNSSFPQKFDYFYTTFLLVFYILYILLYFRRPLSRSFPWFFDVKDEFFRVKDEFFRVKDEFFRVKDELTNYLVCGKLPSKPMVVWRKN
jgi:hypothetical protein